MARLFLAEKLIDPKLESVGILALFERPFVGCQQIDLIMNTVENQSPTIEDICVINEPNCTNPVIGCRKECCSILFV